MTAVMKLKDMPWKESYDKPRQHIKKRRHNLLTKVRIVKTMVFPEVMYGYEAEPHSLILSNCAGEVS